MTSARRRSAARHLVLIAAAWFVAGCAGGNESVVRSSAAAEFRCDERAIRVTYLGDDHYQATGCGQRERFAFHDRSTCPSGRCPYRGR